MFAVRLWCVMALAVGVAGCAKPQAMFVAQGTIANPVAKYKGAMALRSVTGGAAMNILTMPGVMDDAFKSALQSSLANAGYLASNAAAKYTIDATIDNLQQPLIGISMEVTATVTYTVTPAGGGQPMRYPVTTQGTASFSDSPMGADRLAKANEKAMQENIRMFLQGLR